MLFFIGSLVHAFIHFIYILLRRFFDRYLLCCIMTDKIIQIQIRKCFHKIFQTLLWLQIFCPRTLALMFLSKVSFLRRFCVLGVSHFCHGKHYIISVPFRFCCCTIETAFCTIQNIYHERKLLLFLNAFCISTKILIRLMFTFYLTHNLFPAKKMLHILTKSSRHRIQSPQTILQLIRVWFTAFVFLSNCLHQFFECYIVRYISLAIFICYLKLFRNTRTDKRNRITDLHILLHIDCRTHHRTVYRYQPRNQFRNIFFHISNNRRTWLRNASGKIMFRNIFQISPRRNICAKRNTANMIDTFLFQISQNFLIFLWIVCQKSRCQNYRNLLSLR